jgi:arsenite methyltransferase
VSDVVASGPMPEALMNDLSSYSACVTGASTVDELRRMLRDAGFRDILVEPKEESRAFIKDWTPGTRLEEFVLSAVIEASKP